VRRCSKDDGIGQKKRQRIETLGKRLSKKIEGNLLRSAVAKASEDLSRERAESSTWRSKYIENWASRCKITRAL